MKLSVNLAANPFRIERVPALLIGVALLGLGVLSLLHLVSLSRVLPQRTSGLQQEAARLNEEASQLRSELVRAPAQTLDGATAARWAALKNIVDRRVFDWTSLLEELEQALPADARLSAITPTLSEGRVELELEGAARSLEDIHRFGRNLEAREAFENPTPVDFAEEEGVQRFTYRVGYRASAAGQVSPPPRSAGGANPAATGGNAR